MPGRIGERFLHDPVCGQLHGFGDPFGLYALDLEFDVAACLAEPVDERGDAVESGSWLERNAKAARLSEHPKDRA